MSVAAPAAPAGVLAPTDLVPDGLLASADIEEALHQTVGQMCDLSNWQPGGGLAHLYRTVGRAVTASVLSEVDLCRRVRGLVFPQLEKLPDAPECAGVYRVPPETLRAYKRGLLVAGELTAVDGAAAGHDGLAAEVVAVGVSLASYDGSVNSWRSTFLRNDFDARLSDPFERLRAALERRSAAPGGLAAPGRLAAFDQVSSLLRRGVMALAERVALLERTKSRWRMGHGTPAPMELLTGSGSMELLELALPVLRRLLLEEDRWVFLPERLDGRVLATLANALEPDEVAVFQHTRATLEAVVETANYTDAHRRMVREFVAEAGRELVIGAFRAGSRCPGQLFVAHADRALEAGTLALADASLQPHKGTPLLLELAQQGAQTGLGMEAFRGVVGAAYSRARAGHMYTQGEGYWG